MAHLRQPVATNIIIQYDFTHNYRTQAIDSGGLLEDGVAVQGDPHCDGDWTL